MDLNCLRFVEFSSLGIHTTHNSFQALEQFWANLVNLVRYSALYRSWTGSGCFHHFLDFFQARLPHIEVDFWGWLIQKGPLVFQFLVSLRILQCGVEILVNLLLGACEASVSLGAKQFPCKTEGVSYESSSFPGSLPAPSPMPLCPPQCHELFPEDIRKWWFLFLLCALELPCEGPELLALFDSWC